MALAATQTLISTNQSVDVRELSGKSCSTVFVASGDLSNHRRISPSSHIGQPRESSRKKNTESGWSSCHSSFRYREDIFHHLCLWWQEGTQSKPVKQQSRRLHISTKFAPLGAAVVSEVIGVSQCVAGDFSTSARRPSDGFESFREQATSFELIRHRRRRNYFFCKQARSSTKRSCNAGSNGNGAAPAGHSMQFVNWFRESWPYIQGHRGSTFVVVIPGEVVENRAILDSILQVPPDFLTLLDCKLVAFMLFLLKQMLRLESASKLALTIPSSH